MKKHKNKYRIWHRVACKSVPTEIVYWLVEAVKYGKSYWDEQYRYYVAWEWYNENQVKSMSNYESWTF